MGLTLTADVTSSTLMGNDTSDESQHLHAYTGTVVASLDTRVLSRKNNTGRKKKKIIMNAAEWSRDILIDLIFSGEGGLHLLMILVTSSGAS